MKDIFDEKPDLQLNETVEETKQRIISSARIAVDELIKVIEEPIIKGDLTDPTAEKMKNAVQSKKIAVFDCFEILARVDEEQRILDEGESETGNSGFAERHARGKK